MLSKLQEIVSHKQREVALIKAQARSFKTALLQPGLSVIGEIKRRSPSKGIFDADLSLDEKVSQYVEGGVSAISVLTDEVFFSGSLKDLKEVAQLTKRNQCPVLRKDFIIDECQMIESVRFGADAVLLIVAVLGEELQRYLELAHTLKIDTLVEVLTEGELEIALKAGADIIGINNRNLHDFSVDIERAVRLKTLIPEGIVTVAASGIHSVSDAKKNGGGWF